MNMVNNEPDFRKLKLAIIGYGKMGKAVESLALNEGHSVVLKINAHNASELNEPALREVDVAIEFSTPENAVKNIFTCISSGIPVVCGTTGWLGERERVEAYCKEKNGALIIASNFSIGVNIFFELNKKLASLMSGRDDYNVSIEEVHHTHKKDAPSGTAISLAEQVIEALPDKSSWINEPSESPHQVVITSIRQDPAPGKHTVVYHSETDDIIIIHNAHNRNGFAKGALLAALFLYNKKGIFSMKDVLGFK